LQEKFEDTDGVIRSLELNQWTKENVQKDKQ
jgi:hypothetical protein